MNDIGAVTRQLYSGQGPVDGEAYDNAGSGNGYIFGKYRLQPGNKVRLSLAGVVATVLLTPVAYSILKP